MIKRIIEKYHGFSVITKATFWFIVCSVLQKGMSVLTTPIFTRMMSTEQHGQFTVYNSWLQIFTIFITLRLNYAVFNKGMSKFKENRDDYVSTMQTITFLNASVLFIIYLIFRPIINGITELPTFIMVALFAELLFSPAIDFWTIRKRYEYLYKPVVYRTLLMKLLTVAVSIVAVLMATEKGYARILSCVAVNLIFGISLFAVNRKRSKIWFNKEYALFAITFNLPLLMHYFSQYILDQFDRIMIQKMVSISAAGLYGVAYSGGLLMKIITQSLNNALIPWQYGKLEKQKLKDIDNVLFLIYILVSACAFIFICFAPEIMKFLGGPKYVEAVYVIPPVALGMVFSFMYTTFANVELFYDQNKFTMYISMGGALLNIILNYFGIRKFGYIAAAYTTLLCYVIFAFAHYFYMTKSVKKKLGTTSVFDTKRLIILSLVVLAGGISIIYFYDSLLVRLMIAAVICIVAFVKRDSISEALNKLKNKAT